MHSQDRNSDFHTNKDTFPLLKVTGILQDAGLNAGCNSHGAQGNMYRWDIGGLRHTCTDAQFLHRNVTANTPHATNILRPMLKKFKNGWPLVSYNSVKRIWEFYFPYHKISLLKESILFRCSYRWHSFLSAYGTKKFFNDK